ncbi:hypothetical protein [Pseudomonas viridiflava]|nr:hypothetical protein [Pseudomonas viridiflava]
MREAVASYMHRATQKLRKQQSLTAVLRVAVLTSPFGDGPKYANSIMCYPPYPTDDVLPRSCPNPAAILLIMSAIDELWFSCTRRSRSVGPLRAEMPPE